MIENTWLAAKKKEKRGSRRRGREGRGGERSLSSRNTKGKSCRREEEKVEGRIMMKITH